MSSDISSPAETIKKAKQTAREKPTTVCAHCFVEEANPPPECDEAVKGIEKSCDKTGGEPCPKLELPTPPDFRECGLDDDVAKALAENVSAGSSLRAKSDSSLSKADLKRLKDLYKKTDAYKNKYLDDVQKAYKTFAKSIQANPCLSALRCILVPYDKGKGCPCPGQTPHHVPPKASFIGQKGWDNYQYEDAPCVCTEGNSYYTAAHGELHTCYAVVARKQPNGEWNREDAVATAADSIAVVYPQPEENEKPSCPPECLQAQMNNYLDKARSEAPDKPIKAVGTMANDPAQQAMEEDAMNKIEEKRRQNTANGQAKGGNDYG